MQILTTFFITKEFRRIHPFVVTNPDGRVMFYGASIRGCASTMQHAGAGGARPEIEKDAFVVEQPYGTTYDRATVMGYIRQPYVSHSIDERNQQ